MDAEETLLKLFTMKHGGLSAWCEAEVVFDDNGGFTPVAVALIKDGRECWRDTTQDLLLWYIGQQLAEGVKYE